MNAAPDLPRMFTGVSPDSRGYYMFRAVPEERTRLAALPVHFWTHHLCWLSRIKLAVNIWRAARKCALSLKKHLSRFPRAPSLFGAPKIFRMQLPALGPICKLIPAVRAVW